MKPQTALIPLLLKTSCRDTPIPGITNLWEVVIGTGAYLIISRSENQLWVRLWRGSNPAPRYVAVVESIDNEDNATTMITHALIYLKVHWVKIMVKFQEEFGWKEYQTPLEIQEGFKAIDCFLRFLRDHA